MALRPPVRCRFAKVSFARARKSGLRHQIVLVCLGCGGVYLEHKYHYKSSTEFVIDAAKSRVWNELFLTSLWAKEKEWTVAATLGMSHLMAHLKDEASYDDDVDLRQRLAMIDDTCFKKVRSACQPFRSTRQGERFKRDM